MVTVVKVAGFSDLLIVAKVIHDNDIESEDPTSRSDSGDMSAQEVPSRSTGTPSVSTRPLTTRQAVLASMVDPSHVSLSESVAFTASIFFCQSRLDEGSRSKKQPLNENELALRREETARKRKNLSEKRLEDEKVLLSFGHLRLSKTERYISSGRNY